MLAIVFPGQGSQTPGFLSPWLDVPGVRARAERLGALAGLDLVAHGTTSDAETIKNTAIAQPLIVAAGLVALQPLFEGTATMSGVGATSGHSVGEITASTAAGVLTDEEAMTFVGARGRGMAEASAVTPTGMSAVLGGDVSEVLDAIAATGLTPANVNGSGQVVAAGTLEQLAALKADPPARAKVIPLQVAGAFHTHHMAPAVDSLRTLAATLTPADPTVALLSNADGREVTTGREVLDRLVGQVSSPVRWDLVTARLAELGVTGLIEVPPAGTLVGLAKRSLRGVELLAVKSPDDLDAARRMIAEHGGGA